jgi:hypothetical protein
LVTVQPAAIAALTSRAVSLLFVMRFAISLPFVSLTLMYVSAGKQLPCSKFERFLS